MEIANDSDVGECNGYNASQEQVGGHVKDLTVEDEAVSIDGGWHGDGETFQFESSKSVTVRVSYQYLTTQRKLKNVSQRPICTQKN